MPNGNSKYVYKILDTINRGKTEILTQRIFPISEIENVCTMLLLHNLATPQWISINCSEDLLSQAMCRIDRRMQSTRTNCYCLFFQTGKNSNCFLFVWSKSRAEQRNLCRSHKMETTEIANIENWLHFLQAPNIVLSPLWVRSKSMLLVYNKVSQTYVTQTGDWKALANEGWQLCTSGMQDIKVRSGLFSCKNATFIANLYVCDSTVDCPNDDFFDEQHCLCHGTPSNSFKNCKVTSFTNNKTKCSPLYYTTVNGSCIKFTQLNAECNSTGHILRKVTYTCENGLEIAVSLLDDFYSDCGQTADDEPIYKSVLIHKAHFSCMDPNEIPCLEGHVRCYRMKNICMFKIDQFGHLVPCRNGGNIENCKEFECNTAFKCIGFCCIPHEHVCDGFSDCPRTDESFCHIRSRCENMFKCKGSKYLCVHLGNVCDKNKNCPFGDDELFCELNFVCPTNCQCLALAIVCSNIGSVLHVSNLPFVSISFQNSENLIDVYNMNFSPNTYFLKMRHNNISEICSSALSHKLLLLDVAFNLVQTLISHCLPNNIVLKMLMLSDNKIVHIEQHSLSNQLNISFLNLSNDNLISFSQCIFGSSVHSLKVLSVRNNLFANIHHDSFLTLKLDVLDTTTYQMCCIVHDTTECHAHKPWYRSCSDLLCSHSLKQVFLAIYILLFIFNICSIILHRVLDTSGKQYYVTVVCVNTADLLCGTYLCLVWATDTHFAGRFVVIETNWRSAQLARFGCLLSSVPHKPP